MSLLQAGVANSLYQGTEKRSLSETSKILFIASIICSCQESSAASRQPSLVSKHVMAEAEIRQTVANQFS